MVAVIGAAPPQLEISNCDVITVCAARWRIKDVRRLTGKQNAFVVAYLKNGFNATQAARTAGYKGNDNTLAVVGCENLRKPKIQERIAAYFEEKGMAANEVLFRLTLMARGDLQTRKSDTKDGPMNHYDAIKALELLGKYHRLFVDRVEHDGEVCLILGMPVPLRYYPEATEEATVETEDPPIEHRRLPG